MAKQISNISASVRARLQNLSRETGQSFELMLTRYALERLLARAIAATFERRRTSIPAELPDALTPAFAEDDQKQRQWSAFLENVALDPGGLADVTATVAEFIMPHAASAARLKWEGELGG